MFGTLPILLVRKAKYCSLLSLSHAAFWARQAWLGDKPQLSENPMPLLNGAHPQQWGLGQQPGIKHGNYV